MTDFHADFSKTIYILALQGFHHWFCLNHELYSEPSFPAPQLCLLSHKSCRKWVYRISDFTVVNGWSTSLKNYNLDLVVLQKCIIRCTYVKFNSACASMDFIVLLGSQMNGLVRKGRKWHCGRVWVWGGFAKMNILWSSMRNFPGEFSVFDGF